MKMITWRWLLPAALASIPSSLAQKGRVNAPPSQCYIQAFVVKGSDPIPFDSAELDTFESALNEYYADTMCSVEYQDVEDNEDCDDSFVNRIRYCCHFRSHSRFDFPYYAFKRTRSELEDIGVEEILYPVVSNDPPSPRPPTAVAPAPAAPTLAPAPAPVVAPTEAPVVAPTEVPVVAPTEAPVVAPTGAPIVTPAVSQPTEAPASVPVDGSVIIPTNAPATAPTGTPTTIPTGTPTTSPTGVPTSAPTETPMVAPVLVVPVPTADVAPTTTTTSTFTQTFAAPAGEAAELTDEQVAEFEAILERSVDFADPSIVADCTLDSQEVVGAGLATTYTCAYSSDNEDVDVSSAPRAFGSFVEENPEALVAAVQEVAPAVTGAGSVSVRSTGSYTQEFSVLPGATPLTATQREAFTDVVESFTGDLLPEGSPEVSTECEVDGEDQSEAVTTLSYSCVYESPFGGVDPATLPSAYTEFVNRDTSVVSTALAEMGDLPIVGARDVVVTPILPPGVAPVLPPTEAPATVPVPAPLIPAPTVTSSTTSTFSQTFAAPAGEAVELTDVQVAEFEAILERSVDFADPSIVADCTLDSQEVVAEGLATRYTCAYSSDNEGVDVSSAPREFGSFVEENPQTLLAAVQEVAPEFTGAGSVNVRSNGSYTQEFSIAPGSTPITATQREAFSNVVESFTEDILPEGSPEVSAQCRVDSEEQTQSVITLNYSCAYESPVGGVDPATLPSAYVEFVNRDPSIVATTLADEAGLPIVAGRDVVATTTVIPVQTTRSYRQEFELNPGSPEITPAQREAFAGVVESVTEDSLPLGSGTVSTECQVDGEDQTEARLVVEYSCVYESADPATIPDAYIQYVNRDPALLSMALSEQTDLPVSGAREVGFTPPFSPPLGNPPSDANQATGSFKQDFEIPLGTDALDLEDQEALTTTLESFVQSSVGRGAPVWADCDVDRQNLLATTLSVEYSCEYSVPSDGMDPSAIPGIYVDYVNSNLDAVTDRLEQAGLPVEGVQATRELPAFVVSPTPVPFSQRSTGQYTQSFAVVPGEEETIVLSDAQAESFINLVESTALTDGEAAINTECSIDDQEVSTNADAATQSLLTVNYTCVFSSPDVDVSSYPQDLVTAVNSDPLFEDQVEQIHAGVVGVIPTEIRAEQARAGYIQTVTLDEGVNSLSTNELLQYSSAFTDYVNERNPEVTTQCRVQQQTPSMDQTLVIQTQCDHRASSPGTPVGALPRDLVSDLTDNTESLVSSLSDRDLPIASVEGTRATSGVFESASRYTQLFVLPEASSGWDAEETELFGEAMSTLEFGRFPNESSAECGVTGQSISSFDASVLAVDYACTLGTSTPSQDAGAQFGRAINGNLNSVAAALRERGIPVAMATPATSPDFSFDTQSVQVCPSRLSVVGTTPTAAAPQIPGSTPQLTSRPTSSPTLTVPQATSRSFVQQIVVSPDAAELDETQQAAFTDAVEEVVSGSLEDPIDTECSVSNQALSQDAASVNQLLEVSYTCEFFGANPDVAADSFASGLNANIGAVDASLQSSGLPVVESRGIDVVEPQAEFISNARFHQVFEIPSGATEWDEPAQEKFTATLGAVDFLPGPSSADCSVVDQSLLSFDDSLLAVDYNCVLGSSVQTEESGAAFANYMNTNLPGITEKFNDRGLPVGSLGSVSSPDSTFSTGRGVGTCPSLVVLPSPTASPIAVGIGAPATSGVGSVPVVPTGTPAPAVGAPAVSPVIMGTTSRSFSQQIVVGPEASLLNEAQQDVFTESVEDVGLESLEVPIDTDCSFVNQTLVPDDATENQVLEISYTCEFSGADPGVAADSFAAGLDSNIGAVGASLQSSGLPVVESRSIDVFEPQPDVLSRARFHQVFEIPSGATEWDESAQEKFTATLGAVDYLAGPSSADCTVVDQTLLSFDDSLLAVDYDCMLGSTIQTDESGAAGAAFANYMNANLPGITEQFNDRGLPVTSLRSVSSPDSTISSGQGSGTCPSLVVLPSPTASPVAVGIGSPVTSGVGSVPVVPTGTPAPAAVVPAVPAVTPVVTGTTSRSFSQQIVVDPEASLLNEAQQDVFTESVEDVGLESLEVPIDTDCSFVNQTLVPDDATENQVLEISYSCEFSGADPDVAADSFASGLDENVDAVDNLLRTGGLSVVRSRNIDVFEPQPDFLSNARFHQVFEIPGGASEWDEPSQEKFTATLGAVDFLPGPSSADCSVVDQSLLSFDDSLLAVDYTCVLGSSVQTEESGAAFANYMNTNLPGITEKFNDRGLPVASLGSVSSPDSTFSTGRGVGTCPSLVVLPSPAASPIAVGIGGPATSGVGSAPVVPTGTPGVVPVVPDLPAVSPVVTETTSRSFSQQIVVEPGASLLNEEQQDAFTASIEDVVLGSLEAPPVKTECSFLNQTLGEDEAENQVLQIEYSCEFVGANPDVAADSFASGLNTNMEAVDTRLRSSGLPVVESRSIDVFEPQPEFLSNARFHQVFEISGTATEWDESTQEKFTETLSAVEFLPGPSSADCSVVDQSLLSFDDSLLALDYDCVLGSSVQMDNSGAAFVEHMNANLPDVRKKFNDRGLPVASLGFVSSPGLTTTNDLGGMATCPSSVVLPSQIIAPVSGPSVGNGAVPVVTPGVTVPTSAPVMMGTPTISPFSATATTTRSFSQQIVVMPGASILNATQQTTFTNSVKDVVLASLEGPIEIETECSFVNQTLSQDDEVESENQVLEVSYSCEFFGTDPDVAADSFASGLDANIGAIDASLQSSGLPVVESRSIDVFQPQPDFVSNARFHQIFELTGPANVWDENAQEIFTETLGSVDFLPGPSSVDCSVVDQSLLSFDNSLLAVDYDCMLGSSVEVDGLGGVFANHVNANLPGITQTFNDRGLPVESVRSISSPDSTPGSGTTGPSGISCPAFAVEKTIFRSLAVVGDLK